MIGLLGQKNWLLDKDPGQLGIQIKKQALDKVLFHVYVLVEELTQVLLVDIPPGPHESEFEKTDHGRWQYELADSFIVRVHHEPLFTEAVQDLFGPCLRCPPYGSRLFQTKGPDRQHGYLPGFLLREEDFQDFRKGRGSRSSLREVVDPVFQISVCVSRCQMSHFISRSGQPLLPSSMSRKP